jgi:hypothetical protein
MRLRQTAALLVVATGLAAAAGCGSKAAGDQRHTQATEAAEAAPPTPDTTPVEVLRTPAGLVLKLSEPAPAVTPVPSAQTPSEAGKPSS